MNGFLQDVRHALRVLTQNPVPTLVAVFTLAIGVGANAAVFSIVNAVLLRALPFRNPDRLVMIHETNARIPKFPVSFPDFQDFQQQTISFEGISAYSLRTNNKLILMNNDGEPIDTTAALISQNLFPLMGIVPLHGHLFQAYEDHPGHDQVVVLSEHIWRQQFGSRLDILGRQIEISDQSFTVVGVIRDSDRFPEEADLWMPLSRADRQDVNARGRRRLWLVGRLKPGVTEEHSLVELKSIMRRLSSAYPEADKNVDVAQLSLLNYYTGNVQLILAVLFGAASLVLLVACVNVANLLLARAAGRSKEFAIRSALGASTIRIVRQHLVESLLLAGVGSIFGLILADVACYIIKHKAVTNALMPRLSETSLDANVVAYGIGVAIITGLVFGAWPAFKSYRPDVNGTLREEGRASQTRMREPVRNILIGAEVTLAVLVLMSTVLLVRSLRELSSINPGFRTSGTVSVQLSLPAQQYSAPGRAQLFYRQLIERLRGARGIDGAAVIDVKPLAPSLALMHFAVAGAPPPPVAQSPIAQIRTASPGYFELMRIPVLKGRSFLDSDIAPHAIPSFIINETLARMYFPGVDPVGRSLVVVEAPTPFSVQIIGVVADVKDVGLDRKIEPTIYGVGYPRNGVLLVHTTERFDSAIEMIRRGIRAVDAHQPVGPVKTMDELIAEYLARRSLLASLMAVFAGLALILSAIGIYGVTAYAVSQRTSEIGIRMALGADSNAILWLFLRQGMIPVAGGLILGLFGAWLLRSTLAALLYGISPADASTYVGVSVSTIVVAIVAIVVPSRRALSVDPNVALRQH